MGTDRLFFYSKSADAYPGKGANEFVSDKNDYVELSNIKDWRKVLSNFHVAQFKYTDGYTYRTIEHVFQAQKIALVSPTQAHWFTVESGEAIGAGDGEEARANRKLAILTPAQLKEWARLRNSVQAAAARCKYAEHPEARAVLLATGEAQLWHVVPRGEPERFLHLEELRQELRGDAEEGLAGPAAAASAAEPAVNGSGSRLSRRPPPQAEAQHKQKKIKPSHAEIKQKQTKPPPAEVNQKRKKVA